MYSIDIVNIIAIHIQYNDDINSVGYYRIYCLNLSLYNCT